MSYLVANNICVELGDKTILKDFSFAIEKGEFWGILGPNGSGKTTFLKTLGGWLPYKSGEVLLEGEPLKNISRKAVAQKISMVSVEEGNNAFTVEETVTMGRFAYRSRFGQVQAEDMLLVHQAMQQVGIFDKRDRYINQLSQGERQKVWVARALAQDVDVLLLDEPTSHLDVKSQSEVFLLLEKLCKEGHIAVVAILHDINLALAFSSHLLLLSNGIITAKGEKKQVLDVQKLTDLYEIPFELNKNDNGDCWAKICYRGKDA